METWYEIEVEIEPAKWAVIRRDVFSEEEARRRVAEVSDDHKRRGMKRACRAIVCTRKVLA